MKTALCSETRRNFRGAAGWRTAASKLARWGWGDRRGLAVSAVWGAALAGIHHHADTTKMEGLSQLGEPGTRAA
jgi:hypothetical protein